MRLAFAAYSCHGSWEDGGTRFLITTPLARASHGARRHCFAYRESTPDVEGRTVVHLSSSSGGCERVFDEGVAFNATGAGKCVQVSRDARHDASPALLLFLLTTALLRPAR